MPTIRPRPGFGLRAAQSISAPAVDRPVSTATSVAVFDGGVDPRAAASPLFPVTTAELTTQPEDPGDLAHGTAVTAAVLYGNVIASSGNNRDGSAVERAVAFKRYSDEFGHCNAAVARRGHADNVRGRPCSLSRACHNSAKTTVAIDTDLGGHRPTMLDSSPQVKGYA
jgi:hypothetical protein